MIFFEINENTFILEISKKIDEKINGLIIKLNKILLNREDILNTIISYNSILIEYDCEKISFEYLKTNISNILSTIHTNNLIIKDIIEIPVCYEKEFAIDIEYVADYNKITTDQVIKIHTERLYRVYFIGFTPGFPYLGAIDKRIETPRLETPRKKIPSGSVGIADNQTGIYPIDSPGGWRIIGRTPFKLYNKNKFQYPCFLKPGNYIKFCSINKIEFQRLEMII